MIERPDTKTRILDAAEKLFGEKGFDATSLRDITTEADVNLAAVNYHFQSKESLIEAVIMRAAAPVNEKRIAMLEAAGPKATIEQIVEAFVGPVLEQEFVTMAPLMARVLASPEIMKRVIQHHMETLSRRFADAVAVALPGSVGAGEDVASALHRGRDGAYGDTRARVARSIRWNAGPEGPAAGDRAAGTVRGGGISRARGVLI